VVVGEPPESFKVKVRAAVLAEKQDTGRVRYALICIDTVCNNYVTYSRKKQLEKIEGAKLLIVDSTLCRNRVL
jgi:hypothetical protein